MVRFGQNALVIEIPCEDNDPADYYTGLLNALFGVYWLATAKGSSPNRESDMIQAELNWIATYLGPALTHLEPAAKQALNQVAQTENEGQPLRPEHYNDQEILAFLRELPVSRFEWLVNQFETVNKK